MAAHARLSPSSAHRWIPCGASIYKAEDEGLVSNESNDAAEMGTAAHELLELCLKGNRQPSTYLGLTLNYAYQVDQYMVDGVQVAFDVIHPELKSAAHGGSETHVQIPVTKEGGTIDAWYIKGPTLFIWDYKNGRHSVSATENPQMKLYALGVLHKLHKAISSVRHVQTGVIQPNHGEDNPIDIHTQTIAQLRDWAKTVVAPAVERINTRTAPEVAGTWCSFCKRAGRCETLKNQAASSALIDWAEPSEPIKEVRAVQVSMPRNQLNDTMNKLPMLEGFIKAVRLEAMRIMSHDPNALPDWKIVESRGRSKWINNNDLIIHTLKRAGLTSPQIYQCKPHPIGKIKALLERKKCVHALDNLTTTPTSYPTIAPISDKRPRIHSNARIDFSEFLTQIPEDA